MAPILIGKGKPFKYHLSKIYQYSHFDLLKYNPFWHGLKLNIHFFYIYIIFLCFFPYDVLTKIRNFYISISRLTLVYSRKILNHDLLTHRKPPKLYRLWQKWRPINRKWHQWARWTQSPWRWPTARRPWQLSLPLHLALMGR